MVTTIIIAITAIISLIPLLSNDRNLIAKLALVPYLVHHHKEWWRMVTSGFVHANFWHLLINMFVLYMFGRIVELYFVSLWGVTMGEFMFVFMYLSAIAVSNIPSLARYKDNFSYTALGASGATSAVVFASILFEPLNKIIIFPIPIPMPAIIFAIIYLAYEHYMDVRGMDNIGHSAHFWGAIYGFVFPIIFKPSLILHFLNQIF